MLKEKNNPKDSKEVVKSTNTSNPIEVKSQLNVNLTKEDLFVIKCSEQEEIFEKEISLLEDLISNIENKIELEEKAVISFTEKILSDFISKTYDTNHIFKVSAHVYSSPKTGHGTISTPIYDIDYINTLKNPQRARKTSYFSIKKSNFEYLDISKLSINLNFTIEHEVENVTLYGYRILPLSSISSFPKKDASSIVRVFKAFFEKFNALNEQLKELKIQKNELEFQLITMDSNKKLKSAFIKNIIKDNPEITKFLS